MGMEPPTMSVEMHPQHEGAMSSPIKPRVIIWLSRHSPTARQLAELKRLFPGHHLSVDKRAFDGADDISARFKQSGATEMIVVAPLSFVRELVKRGIHPIWAEMRQVTRGSPLAEVRIRNRYYAFVKFHRIRSISVNLEDIQPWDQPEDDSKPAVKESK